MENGYALVNHRILHVLLWQGVCLALATLAADGVYVWLALALATVVILTSLALVHLRICPLWSRQRALRLPIAVEG